MKRTKESPEQNWVHQLANLLLGKSNDAVKLAYLEGDDLVCQIDQLDLSLLSEFKRSANGAVEIKLVDRVRAMEELITLLQQKEGAQASPTEQAAALYRALEQQAGERTT